MNKIFAFTIASFLFFSVYGGSFVSPNASFEPKPGVEISDIAESDSSPLTEVPPYKTEKIKIQCGRDKVNTEVFYPTSGSNLPIVILLHGSHPKRTDAYYDVMAIDLAMHGYYCVFPHYFERNKKGRGTRTEWMKTIGSAIDFAQQQENVNKDRVAVIGYSLGAFLILGYAPTDARINCVVAFYGGLSDCYTDIASEHMPPTLLLHGTKDRIVPARRSLEAFKTLREYGKPVSVVIYPDVGHGFTLHKKGEWDDSVSLDSWERTLTFLNYYLNFPSWTPEVSDRESDLTYVSENPDKEKDPFEPKKFETPYLDKAYDCGEKLYIDPQGEEYSKVMKESQPSPKKKKVVHKKSNGQSRKNN
jgi:dienelactone hydrolase